MKLGAICTWKWKGHLWRLSPLLYKKNWTNNEGLFSKTFFLYTFLDPGIIYSWSYFFHCVCAQSCPTLCNPMDCSPQDASVHGIFQARILEWVAISSSRGSSLPRDWTCCLLYLLYWQADSYYEILGFSSVILFLLSKAFLYFPSIAFLAIY